MPAHGRELPIYLIMYLQKQAQVVYGIAKTDFTTQSSSVECTLYTGPSNYRMGQDPRLQHGDDPVTVTFYNPAREATEGEFYWYFGKTGWMLEGEYDWLTGKTWIRNAPCGPPGLSS